MTTYRNVIEPREVEFVTSRYDDYPRDLWWKIYTPEECLAVELAHPEKLVAAPVPEKRPMLDYFTGRARPVPPVVAPVKPKAVEPKPKREARPKYPNVTTEAIIALQTEGRSMAEIATILGCGTPLLSQRLFKARKAGMAVPEKPRCACGSPKLLESAMCAVCRKLAKRTKLRLERRAKWAGRLDSMPGRGKGGRRPASASVPEVVKPDLHASGQTEVEV